MVTADAALSALIGVLRQSGNLRIFEALESDGCVATLSDAALVAALLSTRDGDRFFPRTLAGFLELYQIRREPVTLEARWEWPVEPELGATLREKARPVAPSE